MDKVSKRLIGGDSVGNNRCRGFRIVGSGRY